MIELFKQLFTYKGRIGRLEFFKLNALFIILMLAIFTGLWMLSNALIYLSSGVLSVAYFFTFIILLATILTITIIPIFIQIRRLHDINCSGWYILLSFVPFVNFILFLAIFFKKGTVGPNKYGAEPKDIKPNYL